MLNSSYSSLGETIQQPRIFCLQASAELVKFIGLIAFTIAIGVKYETEKISWIAAFAIVWAMDGIAIILLLWAMLDQVPYIKTLVRLGLPRIGDNPSATEMIGISAKLATKLILTILFLWFEINLAKYLDGSHIGLAHVGIPLYIVQLLGIVYAILIIDFSIQVCVIDLCSIVFYLLMVMKYQFGSISSIWIVFTPVYFLLIVIVGALLHRRMYSSSLWSFKKKIIWWTVLAGSISFIVFVSLFCARISYNDQDPLAINPSSKITPLVILFPLFLGLCLWSIPISFYAKEFVDPFLISRDYFELSQIQHAEERSLMTKSQLMNHTFEELSEEDSLISSRI